MRRKRKMKIGTIGAGNVGTALTTASRRAGHDVTISSNDPADAQKLAAEVGAQAARSNREDVAASDLVILAVPFDAVEAIVAQGGDLAGKVLIDVTNRFDPMQLTGESNAERIQKMAPQATVVKAFNTIFAAHQADPTAHGVQLDGFVAGEDGEAKAQVLEFVRTLGFRPIDASPLAMSRALEGMGTLNIALNMKNQWPWQTGWKLLGPTG
ncbi:MAG TPA: NADPH-dependent F420 reductase [Fimbriimonas sp.]